MLGGREGALEVAGVNTKGDDFSFGFLTVGFNKPRIVFSLNKGAKFVLTHFLMISALL